MVSTSGAVAAPAIAQASPEIKWWLTASWPKSLDTLYGAADNFARYVRAATDNRFQAGRTALVVAFEDDLLAVPA